MRLGTRVSTLSVFGLARPWKFPAGHADSLQCRRHLRLGSHIPVKITLVRPDGCPYDTGTGVILNLSCSGAFLGNVLLSRGRLLAGCFPVELRPSPGATGDQAIVGRILRIFSPGFPGIGLEFLFPRHESVLGLRRMTAVVAAHDAAEETLSLSVEPWRDQPT